DKFGIIHNSFGKAGFPFENLYENGKALLRAIVRARPPATKGQYIKSLAVTSTMGASFRIDPNAAVKELATE
ncbi:MAG: 50S ribosomal protein L1, partial [Thermovirga sp.]|nr:50S ribosomal protein L1 [Thermovirga sp.]